MKPCRSPYCECTPHQCNHPHYYDARHLPFYQHTMPIKPTHQTAYNYAMAITLQRDLEDQLSKSLQLLNLDNQIFGLADAVEGPYSDLVEEIIGPDLWDWLQWWMYECDHGTKPMEFTIHGTSYDPTTMTLYRFLEIVDAS